MNSLSKSDVYLPLINNYYRYPRMYDFNVPYIADLGVWTQIVTVCIGSVDWVCENAWLWSSSPDVRFTFTVYWFCYAYDTWNGAGQDTCWSLRLGVQICKLKYKQ